MAGIINLPVYKSASGGNAARRAVKATVYPKAGGTPYIGYVIDGRTYKDPDGKVRIDDGSRVELNDGRSYIYNRESGGVPNYATAMQGYESALKADLDSYRESGKKNDRAVDLAVKQTVSSLQGDREKVAAEARAAEQALKDAYIQASNPYGAIGQRLEALGLGDSGYAESTYAKLGGDYQQAVGQARAAQIEALSAIDAAISRAYSDGEIEKAKAWRELEREILGYSMSGREKLMDMQFKAASAAAEDERWTQEWESEQEEREYQRWKDSVDYSTKKNETSYERALDMIKLGVSSPEIARALGISESQAQAIAYRAVAKKGSSSSSGSSKSSKSSSSKKSSSESKKSNVTSVSGQKTAKMTDAEKSELERQMLEKKKKLEAWIARLIYAEGITDPDEIQRLYDQYVTQALNEGYIDKKTMKDMY